MPACISVMLMHIPMTLWQPGCIRIRRSSSGRPPREDPVANAPSARLPTKTFANASHGPILACGEPSSVQAHPLPRQNVRHPQHSAPHHGRCTAERLCAATRAPRLWPPANALGNAPPIRAHKLGRQAIQHESNCPRPFRQQTGHSLCPEDAPAYRAPSEPTHREASAPPPGIYPNHARCLHSC